MLLQKWCSFCSSKQIECISYSNVYVHDIINVTCRYSTDIPSASCQCSYHSKCNNDIIYRELLSFTETLQGLREDEHLIGFPRRV